MKRHTMGLVMGVAMMACLMPAHADDAQLTPAKPKKSHGKLPDAADITAMFESNDDGQINQAVQLAIQSVNNPSSPTRARHVRIQSPKWQQTLLSQKRCEQGEALGLAAIHGMASDVVMVESWQEFRVRLRLQAGKSEEALALAKSLYNVCRMPDTNRAIDLICECLYEVHKGDDAQAAVKRFKLEQLQGASTPAPGDPNAKQATKTILSEIKVDQAAYVDGLEAVDTDKDSFTRLTAQGNLLLLADQPDKAKDAFNKAYTFASDKTIADAAEGIARTMRAEDGTVGRANQYILSLRPQEPAHQ